MRDLIIIIIGLGTLVWAGYIIFKGLINGMAGLDAATTRIFMGG